MTRCWIGGLGLGLRLRLGFFAAAGPAHDPPTITTAAAAARLRNACLVSRPSIVERYRLAGDYLKHAWGSRRLKSCAGSIPAASITRARFNARRGTLRSRRPRRP